MVNCRSKGGTINIIKMYSRVNSPKGPSQYQVVVIAPKTLKRQRIGYHLPGFKKVKTSCKQVSTSAVIKTALDSLAIKV